jgi:nitric oxide reductase large subunit
MKNKEHKNYSVFVLLLLLLLVAIPLVGYVIKSINDENVTTIVADYFNNIDKKIATNVMAK